MVITKIKKYILTMMTRFLKLVSQVSVYTKVRMPSGIQWRASLQSDFYVHLLYSGSQQVRFWI